MILGVFSFHCFSWISMVFCGVLPLIASRIPPDPVMCYILWCVYIYIYTHIHTLIYTYIHMYIYIHIFLGRFVVLVFVIPFVLFL